MASPFQKRCTEAAAAEEEAEGGADGEESFEGGEGVVEESGRGGREGWQGGRLRRGRRR